MKKRLFLGFLTLAYLMFCSSGFAYLHVDTQEQVIHFTHQDGHSDEYHSDVPGKAAIKAFFAKKQVKSTFSNHGGPMHCAGLWDFSCNLVSALPLPNLNFPVKKDRYIHHSSFLL